MSKTQQIAKELFDRAAAALLLVLTSPVFLFAVLLIKLSSRGPVFFTQQRVGLNHKLFKIYKFRTMHIQQPKAAADLVTIRKDPRVFFVGAVLRKWKIDELPQLLNVLNGTMSLVGPRPTVTEDYNRMNESQRRRVAVKPGLTGLAQIKGGAAISWPRRIEFDLYYMENHTLSLDARILFATAWLIVSGKADAVPTTHDEWSDDNPRNQTANSTPARERAA